MGPKIKIKPIQNIYGNGIGYIIGLAMEFFFFSNARFTNYFTKKFTNRRCGEWLLVNKKMRLIVDLDKNQ